MVFSLRQPHSFNQLNRPLLILFGDRPVGDRWQQDVFDNRQLRQQVMVLKDEADVIVSPRGQLLLGQLKRRLTIESHFARCRPIQRTHDVQ